MTNQQLAREIVEKIIDEADDQRGHYSPCLRDDMHDDKDWIIELVRQLLDAHHVHAVKP